MEINKEKIKEKIKELVDYTWNLEEQMRSELLENFLKLSNHKSEIDKIRDLLIDIELSLNQNTNQKEVSEVTDGNGN